MVATGRAQAAQATLNACFATMHEPDEKFNAACYFKKNLYDDMEWQARPFELGVAPGLLGGDDLAGGECALLCEEVM